MCIVLYVINYLLLTGNDDEEIDANLLSDEILESGKN